MTVITFKQYHTVNTISLSVSLSSCYHRFNYQHATDFAKLLFYVTGYVVLEALRLLVNLENVNVFCTEMRWNTYRTKMILCVLCHHEDPHLLYTAQKYSNEATLMPFLQNCHVLPSCNDSTHFSYILLLFSDWCVLLLKFCYSLTVKGKVLHILCWDHQCIHSSTSVWLHWYIFYVDLLIECNHYVMPDGPSLAKYGEIFQHPGLMGIIITETASLHVSK